MERRLSVAIRACVNVNVKGEKQAEDRNSVDSVSPFQRSICEPIRPLIDAPQELDAYSSIHTTAVSADFLPLNYSVSRF